MKVLVYLILLTSVVCLSHAEPVELDSEIESFFIIDKIIGRIIRPTINKIKNSFNRILDASINKAENLQDIITTEIDVLAEVLRPYAIRIINISNDFGADISGLIEHVRNAFRNIINDFRGIADENKKILLNIMDHVMNSIFHNRGSDDFMEEIAFGSAPQTDSYLIIDRIFNTLIRPFVQRIKSSIERIVKAMNEKKERINEIIQREIDNLIPILKPSITRIMELLNSMGADVDSVVQNLRNTLSNIIENMKGIREENKKMLVGVINKIVDRIIDRIAPEPFQTNESSNYLILDKIFARFFQPIVDRIKASIERIVEAMNEKKERINEIIQREIDNLIPILKPSITRIIELLKSMGADVDSVVQNLRNTLSNIIDNMKGIREENKKMLVGVINKIVDRIIDRIAPEPFQTNESSNYLILDKIFPRFFQPIIDRIKASLERIMEAMKEKKERINEIIQREIDNLTPILKPSIIRIMELLSNMGADVDAIVTNLRNSLANIVENMKGIKEENKRMLIGIVNRIVDLIIDKIAPEPVKSFSEIRQPVLIY